MQKETPYSLKKSKKLFLHVYNLFHTQKKQLTEYQEQEIFDKLKPLEEALIEKNREKAYYYAKEVEALPKGILKKSSFVRARDLLLSLSFALFVAILVRQMWFEFYEIPTGSMRPTLKEHDRLVVSKTDFGINLPLANKQLYFDNALAQRSSIFTFSGADMPIGDVDTRYFYLFPGKKQYIKRMMGKPGDSLYFYGGLIYGVDEDGNDISKELQSPSLHQIEHIPFIHFEGKTTAPSRPQQGVYSPLVIHQMNRPVARLSLSPYQTPRGELIHLNPAIKEYGQLWGFNNFAMARLLTPEESGFDASHAMLYLQLQHHPSLSPPQILQDERGLLKPALSYSTSFIPLTEQELKTLFKTLYTARFRVKDGRAYRFGLPESYLRSYSFFPTLKGVPDGCYEFYHGKAYAVKWQGITVECPPDHPLYQFSKERIQLFYNLGIEFDTHFAPKNSHSMLYPSRYAYYRHGDLYLMGSPVLHKDSPTLKEFLLQETQKQKGFIDNGPPLQENGELDSAFVKTFGLTIPEKSYLALGDNHAMSADSRDFGCVPQNNLRGGPDFIFWPPGSRFGRPNQPPYPFVNLPRSIIWLAAAVSIGAWRLVQRKRTRLPLLTRK